MLALQALFQKHFLTRSLMLTVGHWQDAEHSVASPPETKLLKWFYNVEIQKKARMTSCTQKSEPSNVKKVCRADSQD